MLNNTKNKYICTKIASILIEKYKQFTNSKMAIFNKKGQNDQKPQKAQLAEKELLEQIDKFVQKYDGEAQALIDLYKFLYEGALKHKKNWKDYILVYNTMHLLYEKFLKDTFSEEFDLERKIDRDPNLDAQTKNRLKEILDSKSPRKRYERETLEILKKLLDDHGLPPEETHPIVDDSNRIKAHYMAAPVAAALGSANLANLGGGVSPYIPPIIYGSFKEDKHFLPDPDAPFAKVVPVGLIGLINKTTDNPFEIFDYRTLGTHWVDAAIRLALGEPLPAYLREEFNIQPPKPQNIEQEKKNKK